jgi:hypothetical protein
MEEKDRKSYDWLNASQDEESSPLQITTYQLQTPTEDQSGNSAEFEGDNHNDNLPSWLREEILAGQNNEELTKSNRKLQYKEPQKKVKKVKQSIRSQEDCCCCPLDPVLYWFRVFHFACGLIGLLAFVSNLYILFDIQLDLRDLAIHFYALLFCLIIVATELELNIVLSKLQILDLWVFRGIFYSFVGIISSKYNFNGLFSTN